VYCCPLFIDDNSGEQAAGELPLKLATVLRASWFNGVEVGIANLDIITERGFWERVESGGLV
jgi:hypothetical protein